MKSSFFMMVSLLSYFSGSLGARSEYLFSPKGNITQRVVEEISKAKFSIAAAVYMITCLKITDALIAAQKRGVDVRVVTDHSSVQSPYGKVYHLMQAGVAVRVFCPPNANRKFPPLMHAKYAVIDNMTSIEGSFNWTQSAERSNEEHVRITDNVGHKDALLKHFEGLFAERATANFCCNNDQIAAWTKKQEQKKTKNILLYEQKGPTEAVLYYLIQLIKKSFFLKKWHAVA